MTTDLTNDPSVVPTGRLGALIGRAREIADLRDLAGSGRALITVTGLAGVGKTRLVHEALDDRVFGWFNAADPLDASSLLPSIEQWAESMLASPNRGPLVMVIDSVDDESIGPELAAILDRFDHLQVIATSRSRLNVRGEVLFRLHPLAAPKSTTDLDLADPLAWPAVNCFVRAAQRVAPTFAVHEGNAASLIELIQLSGGLPLALELAAQWLRVCDIDELVTRAARSLEPFSGSAADLPAGQHDLRVAIGSAVDALPTADAEVLSAMAHLGAVSLEGLGEGLGRSVPLEVLGRLIDSNLVQHEAGPDRQRTVQISVHPLVRQVVTARDDGRQLGGVAQTRFIEWLTREVGASAPLLTTVQSRAAFARVDHLIPDVNAALDLLLEHPPAVAELVVSMSSYWYLSGAHRVLAFWTTKAIDAVPAGSPIAAELHSWASKARQHLDIDAAATHALRVTDTTDVWGQTEAYSRALSSLIEIRYNSGGRLLDEHLDEALAACSERGLGDIRSILLGDRALALLQDGHADDARICALASIDAAESVGDIGMAGLAHVILADIESKRRDFDASLLSADEAIRLGAQLDDRCVLSAHALSARAMCFTEQRRYAEANAAGRLAIAAFESLQSPIGLAQAARDLGHSLAHAGEPDAARAAFERSIELWWALDQRFLMLVTLATVALCPPPVQPPLELCDQVLRAVEAARPGFLSQQNGYWHDLIEQRSDDIRRHLGAQVRSAPVATTEALRNRVLAHLRADAAGPLPFGLSTREADVLALLADGSTDREVAEELSLSVRTVNSHVSAILRKLGVTSRRQAAAWYRANRIRA
ncbi:MAG: LuxR C-terminal-related transcriptional regulator [Actinomycetota bacterium]|nr:LuxR C-terminal-related transcriptional regulator [Actinomycetota bacterium]